MIGRSVEPRSRPTSTYTDVDIDDYLDDSVGEYDFLPTVPSSPLASLFTMSAPTPPPSAPPPLPPSSVPYGEQNYAKKTRVNFYVSPATPKIAEPPVNFKKKRQQNDMLTTLPKEPDAAVHPVLEKTLKKPHYAGKLELSGSDRLGAYEKQQARRRSFWRRHRVALVIIGLMLVMTMAVLAASILAYSATMNTSSNPVASASAPAKSSLVRRGMFDSTGSGDGTYYDVGLGACGATNSDEELVCALNHDQFGEYVNGASSPACGACLMVTGPLGSVKVRVVDKCPGCKNGDLDLSPAAFNKIGAEVQGRIKIDWHTCDCDSDEPITAPPTPPPVTPPPPATPENTDDDFNITSTEDYTGEDDDDMDDTYNTDNSDNTYDN